MKKKLMPLVLLGLLTIGGLAGCGCDETPTTTVVTPTTTVTTTDPTTVDPTTPDPTTPDPTTPDPTTPDPTTPTPTTPSVVHVDSIDLSSDKATLVVGETATLTVTVLPENADDKSYALTTSEDGVVAIDGTTVTAVAAGTVTITATSTDGAKTDTVTITVNNPAPLYKEIPFSLETDLDEKTISYWAAEEVSATTIDNEDGTYGITYTSVDASWVGLQVLYKNSDLVDGQAYLLEWSLNSSVAGNITINGQTVALVAGDNAIGVKYVCGTDTSATTALIAQFGTPADGLLADGTLSFSVPTWTETSLHDYDSENWTQVEMNSQDPASLPAGTDNYWWFENEPNVISQGNPIFWTNGLANNAAIDSNYDISVSAQGTTDDINAYNQQVGILAWYHDADNYVLAYGEWNQEQFTNPARMRQFHIGGRINGVTTYGDFWADFEPNASYSKPLSFQSLYEVTVRTNDTKVEVSLKFNNNTIGSKDFNISHLTDRNNEKAGIYCAGPDTITFSNYTYTKVDHIVTESPNWSQVNLREPWSNATPGTGSYWRFENEPTIVAQNNPVLWTNGLVHKDYVSKNYSVSFTAQGTMANPVTTQQHIGVVAWYHDDNNFILAYCDWSTDRPEGIREFQICATINGTMNWFDLWGDNPTYAAHAKPINNANEFGVDVTTSGNDVNVALKFNGVAVDNKTYTFGDGLSTSGINKAGIYCAGPDEITISNYTYTNNVTPVYTSDSWTVRELKNPWGMPVVDGNYWRFEEDPNIISSGNSVSWTQGITNNTAVAENYDITVKAQGTVGSPTTINQHVGILAWYHDDNNYILAYCDWSATERPDGIREFQICAMIDGSMSFFDLWGDNPTYAAHAKPINNLNEFGVSVRTTGNDINVALTFNGVAVDNKTYTFNSLTDGDNYAGVYSAGGDIITFSKYNYSEVTL